MKHLLALMAAMCTVGTSSSFAQAVQEVTMELEVFVGCTDTLACNYDPIFQLDNGSCLYPGCADSLACNFSTDAGCNDGSCVFPLIANDCALGAIACGEGLFWNEELQRCEDSQFCAEDIDADGQVGTTDLLQLLTAFGIGCEPPSVPEQWECGDPLNYNGYNYSTTQIANTCWFSENLRTDTYVNGDSIPLIISTSSWFSVQSDSIGARTYYEPLGLDFAGYYYNGYAVIDDRGLCPAGWHVSTDSDWMIAEFEGGMPPEELDYDGGERGYGNDVGLKFQSVNGWSSEFYNFTNQGTNALGFNAYPTGRRFGSPYGGFNGLGNTFWCYTSTVDPGTGQLWTRRFHQHLTVPLVSGTN